MEKGEKQDFGFLVKSDIKMQEMVFKLHVSHSIAYRAADYLKYKRKVAMS